MKGFLAKMSKEGVTRHLSGMIVEAFSRAPTLQPDRARFCDALLFAHSRSSRDACIVMKSLRESIIVQNGKVVLTSFVDKRLIRTGNSPTDFQ